MLTEVTGDSWPTDQHHYPSSNLKVVFWSDDRENSQGKGFSLQFRCSAIEQVPSQQESGDSIDALGATVQ